MNRTVADARSRKANKQESRSGCSLPVPWMFIDSPPGHRRASLLYLHIYDDWINRETIESSWVWFGMQDRATARMFLSLIDIRIHLSISLSLCIYIYIYIYKIIYIYIYIHKHKLSYHSACLTDPGERGRSPGCFPEVNSNVWFYLCIQKHVYIYIYIYTYIHTAHSLYIYIYMYILNPPRNYRPDTWETLPARTLRGDWGGSRPRRQTARGPEGRGGAPGRRHDHVICM